MVQIPELRMTRIVAKWRDGKVLELRRNAKTNDDQCRRDREHLRVLSVVRVRRSERDGQTKISGDSSSSRYHLQQRVTRHFSCSIRAVCSSPGSPCAQRSPCQFNCSVPSVHQSIPTSCSRRLGPSNVVAIIAPRRLYPLETIRFLIRAEASSRP